MNDVQITNAIIEKAEISLSRGFILDCNLTLKLQSGGMQGFGGYVLGGISGKAGGHEAQPNVAAEFICSVLRAAGVESFSCLAGKPVRIQKGSINGRIEAIGHILDDDKWFNPSERLGAMTAGRE